MVFFKGIEGGRYIVKQVLYPIFQKKTTAVGSQQVLLQNIASGQTILVSRRVAKNAERWSGELQVSKYEAFLIFLTRFARFEGLQNTGKTAIFNPENPVDPVQKSTLQFSWRDGRAVTS